MLDDDDLEFTALIWPGGGWGMTIIGIIVIVVMAIIVSGNKEECAAKHCDNGGTSMLMNHECLCVEKAK